jgi:excisionase family DNA binding protein
MQINPVANEQIFVAAAHILSDVCPEVTPTTLLSALKSFGVANSNPASVAASLPPKLYTKKEVAAICGVNEQSVYHAIKNGYLKAVKVGSKKTLSRITAEALNEYLGIKVN